MTVLSLIARWHRRRHRDRRCDLLLQSPVTLRIAVGPANSDDLKVIQSIARVFDPQAAGRDRSSIRLRVVPTDGSVQSAVAMEAGQADLAVVRGDLKLPKDAQAVASLRKNVVAIWVPTPPEAKETKAAKGKKAAAAKGKNRKIEKIEDLAGRRVGVVGRSQSNVNVLRLILQQYGVPADKVEVVQFAPAEVNEAIRSHKADAFLAVGPINSQITTDAIAATLREGGTPTFLPIDLADAIESKYPIYDATEIAAGAFGTAPARPEESVKTISFNNHHRRAQIAVRRDRHRLYATAVLDAPGADRGECRKPRASRCPTPTRTPRSRCIPAPRPMSTAKRRPSWIAGAI